MDTPPAMVWSEGRQYICVVGEVPPNPQNGLGSPARWKRIPDDGREYMMRLQAPSDPSEPVMVAFAP